MTAGTATDYDKDASLLEHFPFKSEFERVVDAHVMIAEHYKSDLKINIFFHFNTVGYHVVMTKLICTTWLKSNCKNGSLTLHDT